MKNHPVQLYQVKTTGNKLLDDAYSLMTTFGLGGHLALPEIIQIWQIFSHEQGEHWVNPTKELVEEAFQIQLEEKQAPLRVL